MKPLLFWAVAVAFVAPIFAPADASAQSTKPSFSHTGVIFDVPADDLFLVDANGDGRNDIAMVKDKAVSLFMNTVADGKTVLPSTKDFQKFTVVATLPNDAYLFTFADVDADGSEDLLYMSPDGVFSAGFHAGMFEADRCLVSRATVFRGRNSSAVKRLDFAIDINADSRSDLVLFTSDGYSLYTAGTDGFTLLQDISTNIDSITSLSDADSGDMSFTVVFPRFVIGDCTGDARPDFLVVKENTSALFAQSADGRFSAAPTAIINSIVVKKKKTTRKKLFYYELPSYFGDVNSDGVLDLVSSAPSKGRTGVYLGDGSPQSYDSPTRLYNLGGWTINQWLWDLDGNGSKELVIMHMDKLGVFSGLNTLSTKTINTDIMVFFAGRNGVFSEAPSYTLGITVPIALFLMPDKEIDIRSVYVVSFDGDFNADGKKDLLVKTKKDSFDVHFGDNKTVFSFTPSITEQLQFAGNFPDLGLSVSDLNGDKVGDLLWVFRNGEGRIGAAELMVSK